MAVGVTLDQMISDLRAEIGSTVDPAQGRGQLPMLVRMLQRAQRLLYIGYDWRFLKVDRTLNLVAGQRFYDLPADLDIDHIKSVDGWWSGHSHCVGRGIGPEHYSAYESRATPATGSFTITGGAAAAATGGFTINAGTLGGSNTVASITVNAVELLSAAVAWGTSHTATAAAVVSAINNTTTIPNYTASNVGAAITITADPDLGATANGYVVTPTGGGDVGFTSTSNMASGANNLISTVKVDGLDLFDGAQIGWRTSNTATAAAVAAVITATYTIPNYTATAAANQVLISSDPQSTASSNGLAVTVTAAGSVTTGTPVDMAGGVQSQRVDPVQRWDFKYVNGATQVEVWPLPVSSTGRLEFVGVRALAPLVADSDRSTLDGDLIVLHAAAEYVKDKGRKADLTGAATALRTALLGASTVGGGADFNLTGGSRGSARARPGPVRVGIHEIGGSS